MTTIRILYFEGCPNHSPVVEMARQIIEEHGLAASVEEVEVRTPDDVERYRFLGSPTVQVDGVDIDPSARTRTDFAMSCRVFGTLDGLPSRQMLLDALGLCGTSAAEVDRSGCCCSDLQDAGRAPAEMSPPRGKAGLLAAGGSVATAMLSSACCWIPLLFLAFGASAAGASAFFERWRPLFIIVAVAMLGLGFYFAYFRMRVCATGSCDNRPPRGRRLQRGMLWVSTILVAAFILFPRYVGLLLGGADSTAAAHPASVLDDGNLHEYVFNVEGMHCEGCAATLRAELAKLDGLSTVVVDHDYRTARITAGHGDGIALRVAEAASRLGYQATLARGAPGSDDGR